MIAVYIYHLLSLFVALFVYGFFSSKMWDCCYRQVDVVWNEILPIFEILIFIFNYSNLVLTVRTVYRFMAAN